MIRAALGELRDAARNAVTLTVLFRLENAASFLSSNHVTYK